MFYACLVAINLAYAVIDIAVKSGFGRLLPAEARSEAFSIKYTLTNIGYAVGPFLGAGLAALAISLPFWPRPGLGPGSSWFIACGATATGRHPTPASPPCPSWRWANYC